MIKYTLVTPERVVYENEVKQVTIPTTTGMITILPHHIPLVSVIQAGEMQIVDDSGVQVVAVAGGFLEVKSTGEVIVLADNAERAEEIDIERAEVARKRAEIEMEEAKNRQDVDYAKLQSILDREMNRIRVGNKYRALK